MLARACLFLGSLASPTSACTSCRTNPRQCEECWAAIVLASGRRESPSVTSLHLTRAPAAASGDPESLAHLCARFRGRGQVPRQRRQCDNAAAHPRAHRMRRPVPPHRKCQLALAVVPCITEKGTNVECSECGAFGMLEDMGRACVRARDTRHPAPEEGAGPVDIIYNLLRKAVYLLTI